MTIITHADLPTTRTYISKSRQHRVVNAATGAKSSTIVEELIPPGGFIPPHHHEVEETLIFLAGEVEVTVGDKISRIGAETTVFIPPHVVHGVRNTSGETVRLLTFFPALHPKVIFTQSFFEGSWDAPARIQLCARYSTHQTPWEQWLFDLSIPLPDNACWN